MDKISTREKIKQLENKTKLPDENPEPETLPVKTVRALGITIAGAVVAIIIFIIFLAIFIKGTLEGWF